MKIFKYPLELRSFQTIELPDGYKPLSVQIQNDTITLWCIVEESAPKHARGVLIFGTGNPMPKRSGAYVGTVQQDGFVWHIFITDKP